MPDNHSTPHGAVPDDRELDRERAIHHELDLLWLDQVVALLSPAQRRALPGFLLRPSGPKKLRGGQRKWGKDRYWALLIHLAGYIDNGLTRTQAVEKCATLYGIGSNKIQDHIKKARDTLRREDLPDWAQWILTKRAEPPTNP